MVVIIVGVRCWVVIVFVVVVWMFVRYLLFRNIVCIWLVLVDSSIMRLFRFGSLMVGLLKKLGLILIVKLLRLGI